MYTLVIVLLSMIGTVGLIRLVFWLTEPMDSSDIGGRLKAK